ALARQPTLIQACGTGLLFGAGDLIAQNIVEKDNDKYDFKRTVRMVAFGTIIAGPAIANWYRFLDKFVTIKNPNKALLARVAIDQAFFAPCFIAVFFGAQGVMEGKSRQAIMQKLKTAYPNALINNYRIWPAVQLINFRFVPLQHRLMVVNVVALGWNTYLSIENRQSSKIVDN
ncbi:12099_t:CDS:2, partial [Ambispora gerdemannii]